MKLLITGGTGFVGSHAARRFRGQQHDVTILGRNAQIGRAIAKEGIHFQKIDLTEKNRIDEAIRGRDVVIHSGGLASPWGPYRDFYEANVVGTKNVVASCLKHGVKRLVYLSTPTLYFNYRHRENIRESDPLPRKQYSNYGATKLLADRIVAEGVRSGLSTISIRPRAVFGPGDKLVLGRMATAIEKGTVPLINGGKSLADLTYIDNCVDAIESCVHASDALSGNIYNITNGEPMAAKDLLSLLQKALGKESKLLSLPFPLVYVGVSALEFYYKLTRKKSEPPLTKYVAGLMARSQTLNIDAARRDLNYRPRVSLHDGIARFTEWWKTK